ncbi:MAG: hypothetical protein ACR2GC_10105 [Methyloceanibacter sp.]|uniref:hypothetical protein n=1 Tax=Methyloceanibacter sp. TaxID=1965321 RepID=UPI003D9BAE54
MTKKKESTTAEKDDPARMSDAERAAFEAKDRDAWAESAGRIIGCSDVLSLFAREIGSELAGEKPNTKLLYLIGTSRLFPRTMNAAIKGTSSGGKSHIRQKVLEFFPPEDVVSFTTLSEKALLYFDDDFAHKILSMGEAAGTDEQTLQDYLLRELISEGRLRYPVVQKVEGQGLVTVTIEKNGPVAFMVTTTRNALHPENETRLLSLEIDDGENQTRAVLRKVAQIEGLNLGGNDSNKDSWQDFQRWLRGGECRVVVPFAPELSEKIPAASVRLRRDFGQILRAIKAHALLHREHRERDADGQIVADIENDYAAIQNLMNALIAESSGVAVRPVLQETIAAVESVTAGMSIDEGASPQAVASILKIGRSAAHRRLRAAISDGFIVNLETRHRQPGRYRLTGQKIEPVQVMPSPAEVMHTLHTRTRPANAKPFETLNECDPCARVRGVHGGGEAVEAEATCARCGGEGCDWCQPDPGHDDPWELPDFLDRRPPDLPA